VSETVATRSHFLDQTLDDVNMERLEDHIKVTNSTLGHPMGFDFRTSFDSLCLGPLPNSLREVELYFSHSD